MIELQYRLASYLVGLIVGLRFHGRGEVSSVILNAFHSNLFHFWSALDLTSKGFFGSARPLFRLIYESLLISKFCSLHTDTTLFQRWSTGDPRLSISRDVLNKISTPDVPELRVFWSRLCGVTHFSIYSGQIELEAESTKKEIMSNYVVLYILLSMNSHLLRCHLLDRTVLYYLDYYGDGSWKAHRDKLREASNEMTSLLEKPGRALVREYSRKWILG